MTQILIVEDNRTLAHGLRVNLEAEGYTIDLAHDGHDGLARIRGGRPDLVILDLMLPGVDGYRLLRTVREEQFDGPVLILSAKGDEMDHVRGFRLGADDYVTKPFGILELLARLDALLRRARVNIRPHGHANGNGYGVESPATDVVRFGAVRVDGARRIVLRDGQPVALRPKELDLLLALIRCGGAVATRDALLDEVWGYDATVISRTVDTHVLELRRKLEHDPTAPRHIITVRKSGYRLQF